MVKELFHLLTYDKQSGQSGGSHCQKGDELMAVWQERLSYGPSLAGMRSKRPVRTNGWTQGAKGTAVGIIKAQTAER